MKSIIKFLPVLLLAAGCAGSAEKKEDPTHAKVANGELEGVLEPSGVVSFKGIPYAAPPVGEFRWREPQPAANWDSVRKADHFGPRAMQAPIFGDMNFRSDGMSEDCLYLNVWTPSQRGDSLLPVLLYYYGGGFVAGDGSEPRYDGESMATKGIVSITCNYRLGAFGFMAHPELTKESPHQASGNYGLLDQSAALDWVKKNIKAFGGDPDRITIAGESAGSISVSAQMCSPLSRNNIAGAIGESGSILGALPALPLSEGEKAGEDFAKTVGATSLADLRALSADSLLASSTRFGPFRFPRTIDGYFFPKDPAQIFEAGEQAHVPLLVGWNSQEMAGAAVMGGKEPTKANLEAKIRELYGENADKILAAYSIGSDADAEQVATELAGDRFIAFSTWRWYDMQRKTGDAPVYRYYYMRPRPAMTPEMGNKVAGLAGGVQDGNGQPPPPPAKGAVHSAEIEYALGNLGSNKVYAWTDEDYAVSKTMQGFFANFIKTGNPNGTGLPEWQASKKEGPAYVMNIDVESKGEESKKEDRYHTLEQIPAQR